MRADSSRTRLGALIPGCLSISPATRSPDAGRFGSVTAETGREFDKLATYLTTLATPLAREVNLVVSLSRTPSLITSPSRSPLLRI